jgi:hypothetical protein
MLCSDTPTGSAVSKMQRAIELVEAVAKDLPFYNDVKLAACPLRDVDAELIAC